MPVYRILPFKYDVELDEETYGRLLLTGRSIWLGYEKWFPTGIDGLCQTFDDEFGKCDGFKTPQEAVMVAIDGRNK